MSGVISPTNLSIYSPSVNTTRGSTRTSNIPRWNTPLFNLDQEDFNMITHASTPEQNTIILMDESAAGSAEHSSQCCNNTNLMCDADRFFQAGEALDSSASPANTRDTVDQLSQPSKSP